MRRFNILQMYSIRWERAFSRETGRMKLKGANIRSFCTSVVAGLIGLAGLNNNGLMPKGLYVAPVKKYADPAETITLGEMSGFLLVRDPYSWNGYNLYWCTSNQAIFITGYSGTRKFTLTNESGILKLTNDSDRRRAYEFAYQNIPVVG